jgi:hypothetical protein
VKVLRIISSLVVLAALVLAANGARETTTPIESASMCSPRSLSAPFTGAERVTEVASYGCEGGWAYLWATIGSGADAVGVTEVLRANESMTYWIVVSRLKVCKPGVMPNYIYRQGCFSN